MQTWGHRPCRRHQGWREHADGKTLAAGLMPDVVVQDHISLSVPLLPRQPGVCQQDIDWPCPLQKCEAAIMQDRPYCSNAKGFRTLCDYVVQWRQLPEAVGSRMGCCSSSSGTCGAQSLYSPAGRCLLVQICIVTPTISHVNCGGMVANARSMMPRLTQAVCS